MRRTLLTVVVPLTFGFGDGPGGVDQADVAESLGEVAQQFTGRGVDLLGEQAEVVAEADGRGERLPRLADLAGEGMGLGQPERAEEEGALLALEAVVGPVPVDEA